MRAVFLNPDTINSRSAHSIYLISDEREKGNVVAQLEEHFRVLCFQAGGLRELPQLPAPDLFIFCIATFDRVSGIMEQYPALFPNALEILWWPDTRTVSVQDLIAGAECGIDYLLLRHQLHQLALARIHGRIQANKQFRQKGISEDPHCGLVHVKESKLIRRVKEYLEKNNLAGEFSIEKMGSDLGMSRTRFYSKIKELTGGSPSQMVMNFRLEKAAEMLSDEDRTISEIAFDVGFSSTAYFTKCFKKNYGTSPSRYIGRNPQEEKSLPWIATQVDDYIA